MEDVPAADTFSVDDVLAVNKIDDTHINVEISFQVTFMKSTYMKYIIERSTNVEMIKWLEVFFAHLKAVSFCVCCHFIAYPDDLVHFTEK